MTHRGWDVLREKLAGALGDRRGEGEGMERLSRAVDGGGLDLSATADLFVDYPFDVSAAVRLLRLWSSLVEHSDVALDAEAVAVASRLARQGEYPTSILLRNPALATWLATTRWRFDPMPRDEMRLELTAYLDAAGLEDDDLGSEAVATLLRQFRHRHLLRIFLRELEGASLRRTTAEVADIAQVCLQVALEMAARIYEQPRLAQRICVIGMGKVGGRELNFSSDVDLVFVADDGVYAEGLQEAAKKVVRKAVELIDETTAEGRVFRVDLRLRPEGSRGALVPSESAVVDYFLSWGRTWERGAWLKARPIAGDEDMGWRILSQIEPFLYRRHLDFDALDELRRMKAMIDDEARASDFVQSPGSAHRDVEKSPASSAFRNKLLKKFSAGSRRRVASASGRKRSGRPSAGWDVKIGSGGIREIEFFVQALQLVHCGLRPELRVRSTLEALDRLLYAGLLSSSDHRCLVDAYDLFRRIEHCVQMESDRQSHRLPADPEGFADLAARMEMSPEALKEGVQESRTDVQTMFRRLFSESPRDAAQTTVGERDEEILENLIGLPADRLLDEEVLRRVDRAGFQRPRQVAGQLQVLRKKRHGPFSESPRSADPELGRHLLRAVRNAPDPEAALGQLVRFSTTVGDTSAMWGMLSGNPHAARLLIHLFGSSPPIGGLLAEEPELFERLVGAGSVQVDRPRHELEEELRARLEGVANRARRMGRIRRFHQEEIVRLALHEVAGAVDVESTCRQLSDLAELVVEALFREVVAEFCSSFELPMPGGDPLQLGLAVVGMGKLGGREMGFGSDLDFIFVYDGDDEFLGDRDGATRIARRLVRALSSATDIGGLYEVDLRLRPSGSQGLLVVSYDAWRDYHLHRAQFWERQALVRARGLTGSPSLRRRLAEGRRELAFERPLPDDGAQQVAAMRQKLAEQSRGGQHSFDAKFDPGGLVDVEFLTQWLQLSAGGDAELWRAHSTFAALDRLQASASRGGAGVDVAGLLRDYRWLRRLECRLAISGAGNVVPGDRRARRALARQMGHQGRDEVKHFDAEMKALRRRVRENWKALFG